MVGDVHAVHRLVGNNEGLGGIALHIGEYVVDLYRIGELTEGMEGRAKSGGRVDYGTAAETVFAAQEWVESQDWSKSEEPSPVQVALKSLRER